MQLSKLRYMVFTLMGILLVSNVYAASADQLMVSGVALNTTLAQLKQSFKAPKGALLSCNDNAKQQKTCQYLNSQGQAADIQLLDAIPAKLTFQFRRLDQSYILNQVSAVFSVHYYETAKTALIKALGNPDSAQQQSVNVYGANFTYRDLIWEHSQSNQVLILNQHYSNGLFSQIILKMAE